MTEIRFVGKGLVVENKKDKILVVSDFHLGFESVLKESGYGLPLNIYKEISSDLEKIFEKEGKFSKIIILGDLKHSIGRTLYGERGEILELIRDLKEKCEELIVVKGNHDIMLDYSTKDRGINLVDFYVYEDFCFIHGDKDFEAMHNKEIKYWVLGHFHPAVTLKEEHKEEKYKCFLVGSYKKKKVIILPSFFHVNEGTDPRFFELECVWDFDFEDFEVYIIDDNLESLYFGKLRQIN